MPKRAKHSHKTNQLRLDANNETWFEPGAGEETRSEPAASDEILLAHSDPEARELYDLAIRVKDLAPWGWMEETDVFGLENPDTGELGFVSIMGSVGEYEAIAVYLGAEGVYGFIDLQENATSADRFLELRHLQAAFSDREFLEKEDRELIKQLGLKFRGANAWPMFRSYRPGYLPWFVTRREARFLIHALSQTLHVAECVRDNHPIKPVRRIEKGGYFVRAAHGVGPKRVWEDQVWLVPPPKPEPVRAIVDSVVLAELKRIPRNKLTLETDLFLAPARIVQPGQRPLGVYTLMIADSDSGFIFGIETMTAEDSLPAMHARIPNSLATLLLQAQIVPHRLVVRSELLRALLRTLAQTLNIELRHSDELPSIDEAAESMRAWMQRGER